MNAVAAKLEAVFNDIAQTRMAGLPICQTCSLLSPIIDIKTQDDAVAIARQLMAALFVPAPAEKVRAATLSEMLETAQPMVAPVLKESLSRRDFLRGGFLGM